MVVRFEQNFKCFTINSVMSIFNCVRIVTHHINMNRYNYLYYIFFSFTALSAELLEALRLECRNSTSSFAKCKYKFHEMKYIFRISNPQPVDFTATLCAPAPRLAS